MSDHGGAEHGDDHHDGDDRHDEDGHGEGHGHDGHGHDHHGDGHGEGHDHTHDDHHAHDAETVGVAVVTVSSSRSLEEDPSGDYAVEAIENAGHEVVTRELIPDDFDRVQGTVNRLVGRADTDAVITTGGTGVTPDDVTPEAVRQLFEKELPGFGELFRRLSYEEVGTRTVGSRAIGGIADGVPVFCLPGSENAVRLGVEEIILPEVGHLAGLATRDEPDQEGTAADAEDASSAE
ncbi:MogA/MoaB family molybdenum cofactor biosynthesis protein [Haloparvum sedimenti]|uniref:MogA/MoaB family molybdenum cofactor biosynthesis protein n=1 Tax=Haloparvum sedimenti TaxID=1678448 RepID=UPI00071E8BF9|nr:MogA/MoaB family molybdenum cofactor biosynthesis protein [Haloparvum sedimenti]